MLHRLHYCAECLKKQQVIDRLQEENARLRARLRYQERQAKEGFFGSSTPSAQRPVKANTPVENTQRPGGAQPGHRGHGRRPVRPDQVTRRQRVPAPSRCPRCQAERAAQVRTPGGCIVITEAPSMDLIIAPILIGYWGTFRRSTDGSLARLKSPRLPPRATRQEAERDLLVYADHKANHPASDTGIKTIAIRKIGGEPTLAQLEAISKREQDVVVHSWSWQDADVDYFVAGPSGGESELLINFRPGNTYRWVRKQLRVVID